MAKISIKSNTGAATVTQALVDNKTKAIIAEEVTQEVVKTPAPVAAPVSAPETPYCMVGVDGSYTKNLGNFQSAKVGVCLSLPAQFDQIDEAFDFAAEWVNGKLETLIADLDAN